MAQTSSKNANLCELWPDHQMVWADIESVVNTKVWIADQGAAQRAKNGTQIRGKIGDGVEEVVIHIPPQYTYMVDVFLRKMAFCKVVARIGHDVKAGATEPSRTNLQIATDGADRTAQYFHSVWIEFLAEVEAAFYPTGKTTGPLTNKAWAAAFRSPTMNLWFLQEYYMDFHDPHGVETRGHLVDHSVDPLTLSTPIQHLCALICISFLLSQKWTHQITSSLGWTKSSLLHRHAGPYIRHSTVSLRQLIQYGYNILNVFIKALLLKTKSARTSTPSSGRSCGERQIDKGDEGKGETVSWYHRKLLTLSSQREGTGH